MQKGRPVHKIQQTGEESCPNSDDENDRKINTVSVTSLSLIV